MAGRGDHYIEHGGYTWRTLDGANPQGNSDGAPNGGCQCTGGSSNSCPSNYLPLPAGWVLAPNDATSIAVVAAHGWSTFYVVLADGSSWCSANGPRFGNNAGASCGSGNYLATSGGTSRCVDTGPFSRPTCHDVPPMYTVTWCNTRVLARCG